MSCQLILWRRSCSFPASIHIYSVFIALISIDVYRSPLYSKCLLITLIYSPSYSVNYSWKAESQMLLSIPSPIPLPTSIVGWCNMISNTSVLPYLMNKNFCMLVNTYPTMLLPGSLALVTSHPGLSLNRNYSRLLASPTKSTS